MRAAKPIADPGDAAREGGDIADHKIRGPQRLSRPSLLQLFSGLGDAARSGRAAASRPSDSGVPPQLQERSPRSVPSGPAGEAVHATQVIWGVRMSQAMLMSGRVEQQEGCCCASVKEQGDAEVADTAAQQQDSTRSQPLPDTASGASLHSDGGVALRKIVVEQP